MTKKAMIEKMEMVENLCKVYYWDSEAHHKLAVKALFCVKKMKLVNKAEAVEEFNKVAKLAAELLA